MNQEDQSRKTEDSLYKCYTSVISFLVVNKLESTPKGFTEAEISNYEKDNAVVFPKAYRLFLAFLANSSLRIFDQQDFTLAGLETAHEVAAELLVKDNYKLGIDRFVFSQWQGYNFYHLDLKSDNPDVELYVEGGCASPDAPPEIHKCGLFTDWLLQMIENSLHYRKQLDGLETDNLITELKKIK